GKSLREIEPLVAGRKQGSRPADHLRRRKLTLELQPETYEMFRQAQAALAETHGHRLSPEELLVAMCRLVLEPAVALAMETEIADQNASENAGRSAGRPAYQLAIKTCPDCKRSWQYGGGRDIEIGAKVLERARCDAEHVGSLDDEMPARKTTTLTRRVREHVFARDGYACAVPGCRRVIGLDIHHIQFQEHGGSHEPSNLVLACNLHHAAIHAGKLVISGRAPDELELAFPRGHASYGIEDLGPDVDGDKQPTYADPVPAGSTGPAGTGSTGPAGTGSTDPAGHAHPAGPAGPTGSAGSARPAGLTGPTEPVRPAPTGSMSPTGAPGVDDHSPSHSHVNEPAWDRTLRIHVDEYARTEI
ncbi:MAG TPA: hypothetical protein VN253_25270, partial [Kofleriaceae bacterium]|nr:hypothetical protein [Kofleriaceae bacterium]